MAFPPLGNSDHIAVSVSIDFLPNSEQDAPFHRIAYGYSWDDCYGPRDHLRDVPWEDIFKLSTSAAASEFCEWVHVGIDVYIPHRKNQVNRKYQVINLEKRLTSRFDGLDIELLNLKDVIIKNLQVENERLRKKVNVLENKVLTLESEHN